MIAADGNQGSPEIMARAGQAFVEYSAYTNEIIESRRRDPQDDLVSILVGAKDDGVLTDFDLALPSTALSEDTVRVVMAELGSVTPAPSQRTNL